MKTGLLQQAEQQQAVRLAVLDHQNTGYGLSLFYRCHARLMPPCLAVQNTRFLDR